MSQTDSRTAEIRRLARTDEPAACRLLAALLHDLFGLMAEEVALNADQYSLNSLNGFFRAGGEAFFFKFHQEEGEEAMSGEYYRADILARAGLPVDQPVHMSALPGEQILVYRRRSDPRLSDVLRALDLQPDAAAEAEAIAAQADLDRIIARVYLDTLHPVTARQVAAEPIHRLFHDRLVDPVTGVRPGGRYRSFYLGQTVELPGVQLAWDRFAAARIVVNGVAYARSIGELFAEALDRLDPARLANCGGLTAHGDAHNANVWFGRRDGRAVLSFFDPAFAGEHVPALLAEVKATFHNCLAHPLWLYDPAELGRHHTACAAYADGVLALDTSWRLSPLRRALLRTKGELVWKPLLAALRDRGLLPAEWQRVIRLALFLCPTLVMNLRAGAATHDATSSAIAFSVAVMAGSEPADGAEDDLTAFLAAIDPGA
ncbi:hypothetical protein [Oryzibacter oryziterrae]|uniref:hypothetical protein n=1 Tax=Oryzibacter oryziterrae TaxID=2766474 RepID=UPI001F49267B|nr:hypothetical protein [Oryzibacter oryziterrae]